MNTPQIFNFEQHEVRTMTIDDEPFFVGKDIADILGYSNPQKAIRDHVDLEDKTQNDSFTVNGTAVVLINESGLYSLILKSRLTNAKKFKRWVTSEVLPAIRKHGGYLTPEKVEEALLNPDTIIQLATKLKEERTGRLIAEQKIAEYEPKISYLDSILSSTDSVTISQIAADYGMSPQQMNKLLHKLGIQKKVGNQWLLCKKHMRQGYTKSHTTEIPKSDGGTKVVMNTKWTQKGRLFIYESLKKEGYIPEIDLLEER
ncbi:phage antirepressor KilAC domain-containing protein [Enterococcus faecium]|uniref:phage antirepressor KilAC domain-containing protein n=1 Tax=Enterococcus TaxID=1350 RepID=UPI000DE9C208|nr:phage antirepressor [Enterococcus faecium]MBD9712267.1 phage antirepressor KilAC domain-containing protein [Enterococcus faecium]MBD9715173.1 phage antirepressor KilAC domain-containing protein [Enterococcus faecium]MBD9737029.1 phage antirepressor KilAC domain-containing protein [Enterococcus faecium]RBS79007.1 bro family toxin-antitoxin system, toxin component [Enterococcus faecium]